MKRLFLSVLAGVSVTFLLLVLLSVLSRSFSPSPDQNPALLHVSAVLLYWPTRFLVVGRFDCPNADLISEKVDCIALAMFIDVLTYSILAYALLLLSEKRRRTVRLRN